MEVSAEAGQAIETTAVSESTPDAVEVSPPQRAPREVGPPPGEREVALTADVLAAHAKVFGTTEAPATAETGEEGAPDTAEAEPQAQPKKPIARDAPPPANANGQDATAQALATLDPTLRLVAKRLGWDDAKLAGTVKALGAEETSNQLRFFHSSLNEVSRRFAELGGTPQQGQEPTQQFQPQSQPRSQPVQPQAPYQQAQPGQQQVQQTATQQFLQSVYGDRLQELTDVYGEEFLERVVAPLHRAVTPALEFARQAQANAEVERMEALKVEVNAALNPILKEFGEVYGARGKRTEQQDQSFQRLLDTADAIRAGYIAKGRNVTVADALEMAHLQVSSDHVQTQARRQLAAAVQQRSRQITSRPTQRRTPTNVGDGAPKSRDSAADALSQRMAELGMT